MTTAALTTHDCTAAFAERMRRFTTKALARRAGTSKKTAENWQQGIASPTFRHYATMMRDPELRIELLHAIGCADLAELAEMKTTLLRAKAALDDAQAALEGVDL